MAIKNLPIVKKTVSIRRNKNHLYKKPFLPQRWDKMFQAKIRWRPRPMYLFTESTKMTQLKNVPVRRTTARMASTNIDREASVMRKRRAPRRRKRGPKKQVYLM